MRKKEIKKRRRFFLVLFCLMVNAYIVFQIGLVFNDVYNKKVEKDNLVTKLHTLDEKNELLSAEVNKLQDKEYIARYAREKFLYSADDEYILKIK